MKCPHSGYTPSFLKCYRCDDHIGTPTELKCSITGESNGQYLESDYDRLTASLAAMTTERDAAVWDLANSPMCASCKHTDNDECGETCGDSDSAYHWEWRGPVAENTRKEE